MDDVTFLQDLTIVLLAAGLVTVVFHRLRQPVVLGYILAGLIIGPNTPPFPLVTDARSIQTLSELGIVMLMFSLGLQFSFRQLARIGPTAFVAAVLEIGLMIWIGYQVGRLFGWGPMDSIFLGAILLSSSTVIIFKTLADLGMMHEKFARFIFGILIIDDMAAIIAIAVLSGIVLSGEFSPAEVLTTGGRISVFLAVVVVLGLLILPRLLRFIAAFNDREVLLVSVLGLGFGTALLAVQLGFSTALGAFLIGSVIGETAEGGRIRRLVEPVRDMFSAIFFVAVGLRLAPEMVAEHWLPVLVITVTLVVGKTFSGALGAFVAGNDTRTSLRVGMGLAQIGEFAFIIAALGWDLGVTSDFLYPIAVSVAGITTLSTPLLIKNSDRLASRIEAAAPQPLHDFARVYSRWLAGLLGARRTGGQVRAIVRRAILQIALNVVLITALFAAARMLAARVRDRVSLMPDWAGGTNTLIFLAAMLLALPLLVATLRKLRALSLLMTEATIRGVGTAQQTAALRALLSGAVVAGGAVALFLYVALLSSAILPAWPVLVVVLGLLGVVAWTQWRTVIQLYARGQVALREALRDQPPPAEGQAGPPLPEGAVLERVEIPADSPACGRLIRQLELRRRTGASIVAIQRDGASIINPAPDEMIKRGDAVLLLGVREQLGAARALLRGPSHGLADAP